MRAAGAEVGRATHEWTADQETWTADIVAVPVGELPFTFDVGVEALPVERTQVDNRSVIRVEQAPRLRMFVFEARPSWSSAFVTRALESDPRFEVSGLSQVSPRVAVRTGASPALPDRPEMLDAFDTIVVGGLDSLTAANVTALERFMTERGGTVALLPDSRPSSALVRQMLSGIELHEQLLDRATPLSVAPLSLRLDASELLEVPDLPPGASALARSPSSRRPIMWTVPRDEGRLLFSGAMDSWRYRAEAQVEFDRFWQSAISALALEARPAVDVNVVPTRPATGERVRVEARVRRLERERPKERLSIAAGVDSGEPVRLWPDARQGTFSGSFVAGPAGRGGASIVTASVADGVWSGAARFAIDNTVREAVGPPLTRLAESHAGVNVALDDLATLERHLRTTIPVQAARSERYPMGSAWWMVPFAACLSGEWWFRRRAERR